MIDDADIVESLPDNNYDGLPSSLPGLRSFMSESDPFMDYIKSIKIDMPRGADIIGILQTRRRVMWDMLGLGQMADWFLMHPEQRRITLGEHDKGQKVQFANPIAYDVWYIYYAGNVLLDGIHPDYSGEEWVELMVGSGPNEIDEDNRMYDFFHTMDPTDTIRPLKQPYENENMDYSYWYGNIRGFSSLWGVEPDKVINITMTETWQYSIKKALFEILTKEGEGYVNSQVPDFKMNKQPTWESGVRTYDSITHPPDPLFGPKTPDGDSYCGYIAFPVGQLGSMWKIGLASHSEMVDASSGISPYTSYSVISMRPSGFHSVDAETVVEQGGKALPPFTMATSEVPGELLINKGWLIADKSTVEYPAKPFDDSDNWQLHYWLRYWIRANNTEIIPGEFVGLICKPWPLHCWFYQESSPFVYAGNWIETEFYTSGIIKEVLEPWTIEDEPMPSEGYYDPEEQPSTAVSNHYRIWIKGEEIIVESSDWKEYIEGERVGLLKRVRDGSPDNHVNALGADTDSSGGDNFDWQGLEYKKLKGKDTADDDIYTRDWVIVPVWFFPDVNEYPDSTS